MRSADIRRTTNSIDNYSYAIVVPALNVCELHITLNVCGFVLINFVNRERERHTHINLIKCYHQVFGFTSQLYMRLYVDID